LGLGGFAPQTPDFWGASPLGVENKNWILGRFLMGGGGGLFIVINDYSYSNKCAINKKCKKTLEFTDRFWYNKLV